MLQQGFTAVRRVLLATIRAKKPDIGVTIQKATYRQLLRPVEEALAASQAIQQANRGNPAFDMLSSAADGSFVLTWVTVEAKPSKRVDEAFAMAQYFGNKVLKTADRYGSTMDRPSFYQRCTEWRDTAGTLSHPGGWKHFMLFFESCGHFSVNTTLTA